MKIASFFTALDAAIAAEWIKIKPQVMPVLKAAEPYVVATAEELAEVAAGAFLGQAGLAATGSIKMSQAVANVLTTLAAQGKTATLSNASAAVQAMVNTARTEAAAPAPAS